MRGLTADELLAVWEWGLARSNLERGCALLAAGCPEDDSTDLLQLSVPRRDDRLLRLREITFGARLDCQLLCPACQEQLEMSFQTGDLLAPEQGGAQEADESWQFEHEGWTVRFRLPNSADLFAATAQPDRHEARRVLLDRLVVEVESPTAPDASGTTEMTHLPAGAPEPIERQLLAELEQRASASRPEFALQCPACGHSWVAAFDIVSFFWAEVEAWSQRTLREVSMLASAYGWSEAAILALSPWRRQAYLQMIGHA